MEDVGARIRIVRKRSKTSQAALADRIEMDRSHLSKIERGDIEEPTEETIGRIGVGLGFGLHDFVQELAAVKLPKDQPYVPVQPGDDLIELRGLLNLIELTRDRSMGLRSLLRGWLEHPPEREE